MSDADLFAALRNRPMYFDRKGQPLTLWEWVAHFEDREYCVIAIDTIGPLRISTVWVGLDRGYGLNPRPLPLETMVFGRELDPEDVGDLTFLYATDTEAAAGHDAIVARLSQAAWS